MVGLREVARWGEELNQLSERIGAHVKRVEPRERVKPYMRSVIGGSATGVERRNGWQLAEAADEDTPYGMQRLIASATWDADEVRDDLRSYVMEHLGGRNGDRHGVLVIDETGFLKKGTKSAGVARQYSGTAGRIENSQVGVFLAYASSHAGKRGHAFIDRELYLPKAWCEDRERCREAGIPDDVMFRTKPELARVMLERALDAFHACDATADIPVKWVTADEVYGGNRSLRMWLEERGQPFVLAVKKSEPLSYAPDAEGRLPRWQPQAEEIAATLPPKAWRVLSAGEGAKGPREYRWAWTPLLRIGWPGWIHALLVRERLTPNEHGEYERAYYVVFAPERTTLKDVVKVAGTRWIIEQGFEAAKQEVGLDEYEVRKYDAWYRYITLSLFAHAFLTVVRCKAALIKTAEQTESSARKTSARKKGVQSQHRQNIPQHLHSSR